ncbi:S-layer homology domain-containing protein [Actinomarinicola tropica]|uniref:SLH domain-containing protein n=1 Tax=Actinomarinicola tropica TaxID=2789776 RepID=A0A5Q2RJU5_9ACTN|nr:S-layer homology domain-containing protein [Actinomarinicola tropica]QGG96093.1 hypothetical protein GH723_13850 [Actinomarinicola tropica]
MPFSSRPHPRRRLLAFLLASALLSAGLTLGPTPEPASAACAARSTRLGGTIQGQDGRYMWVMLGLEYFDAAGRRLDANGCVMPTGQYSDLYRINRNMMSGHGSSTSDGGRFTKNWSIQVPNNAATVWIEAYPRTNDPYEAVSTERYGHAMRRAVPLPNTNLDIRMPLNCGVQGDNGVVGQNGSIAGRLVVNGRPVDVPNIHAWNVDPNTSNPIWGWGDSPRNSRGNGYYRVESLAPNQHYTVWMIDGNGHIRKSPPLWVAPCQETVWEVVEGADVLYLDWFAGFVDARASAFYGGALAWLRGNGLTTGISPGVYAPNNASTRAEVVTFMWRVQGEPARSRPHGFVDVVGNPFYERALRWAAADGLTTGVGGSNRFDPNGQVTRGELVTFLHRLAGRPGGHPSTGFVDVRPGAFYDAAVRWASARGLTTGVGGSNRFEPDRPVTRAEIAVFLWRFKNQPAPPNPGDAVNCTSFTRWSEAKAWHDIYSPRWGDVAGLRSGGTVCPSLPGAPLR